MKGESFRCHRMSICVKWKIEINDELFYGVGYTFVHKSKIFINPFFANFVADFVYNLKAVSEIFYVQCVRLF